MRAGEGGHWATDDPGACGAALFKRLVSRVAYGGRKGHRAFLRLWQARVRPRAFTVTFAINGFILESPGVAARGLP